jgi:uncharacterized protein
VQLEHTFRIPVPVDEAWTVLRDIKRVAPCMPGATIDSVDGDDFTGGVKVKVGPISLTYKGDASFVNVDEVAHRATIEAKGRETRGSGTARATITAELDPQGGETEVRLVTDLAVTGRPAQFGRGVMADVGGKLVGQFADCLSAELGRSDTEEAHPLATPAMNEDGTQPTGQEEATGPSAPAADTSVPAADYQRPTAEAIDLLDVAGTPLLKRFGPLVGAVSALLVLLNLLRGRRRRRKAGLPTRRQARRVVKGARREARIERKVAKAARTGNRAERRTVRSERRTAKAAKKAAKAEQRATEELLRDGTG